MAFGTMAFGTILWHLAQFSAAFSGPSPWHVYCILAQLTNSNVLGKSPTRDLNNRETGDCYCMVDLVKIQYTCEGETTRFMNKR